MKNTIKKIIMAIIIVGSLSSLFNEASADYCGMDNSPATCAVYTFYTGQHYRTVEIFVPENIEWYEWLAMTGQLDTNTYEFKLVFLNTLLIKKGFESIY